MRIALLLPPPLGALPTPPHRNAGFVPRRTLQALWGVRRQIDPAEMPRKAVLGDPFVELPPAASRVPI